MKKFEYLPHPADVKIRVYGKTIEDIFHNALLALFEILKPQLKNKKINENIEIKSFDQFSLLVDFLNEVLALSEIKKVGFYKLEIKNLTANFLKGELEGGEVVQFEQEVKAITYHQGEIKKRDNYYLVDIILDV